MKSDLRNWSDIRVFLAVMRKGSTLAASRGLGIAQPTVARRIEALEHETGLTLFDRDTRGFRPTEAALAILPDAEAIEAAADGLAATVRGLTCARPIRITGNAAKFSPRVSDIFSQFSERHPEVRLDFLPGVRPLDLMAGEADVALRLSWSRQHPDLICRHISTARFTLYGAPSYAEARGLPERPEDMKDHTVFTFQRDDVQPVLHDWVRKYVAEEAIARSFSEITVMDAAVRAGKGLGIMNLRMVVAEEAAGTLIRCFDPPKELDAPHMVLIAPEAYRRPEVKAFAKFFIPRYAALFR
ncbi:LysR family transcriptional regulator [Aestuariicoccus sp. MJ-SS9]|uniref:LysR family transcriptional regulator n=1 Tax=Aestuariicoccus sp. MJ-SS9 TaxID=3079855 RepID=UPI002907F738|nr:LysR family transcriptional regulator [Aestuariicoccus sp. MJ-SS9]MDU8909708.1 LysR family transcriptional regulator [Aestuariicoccus sp. MJ-SS9]